MSSDINPSNIDGLYPVAGQDNDSQGFRDNFTNIKNNFTSAKSEIEDLQNKVVLKSALTGSSLDNDMADGLIYGARVRDFSEVRADKGTTGGTVTFNHLDGHYQMVQTSGDITLAFSNWPPAGNLGRIRVAVTIANVSHDVTLPAAVTRGLTGLAGYNPADSKITFDRTGTYLLEFTTDDNGATINVQDMSRGRNVVPLREITDTLGRTGDVAGMMVLDTANSAIWFATADYDGSTAIWKKSDLT